jgi:hypothetical protein
MTTRLFTEVCGPRGMHRGRRQASASLLPPGCAQQWSPAVHSTRRVVVRQEPTTTSASPEHEHGLHRIALSALRTLRHLGWRRDGGTSGRALLKLAPKPETSTARARYYQARILLPTSRWLSACPLSCPRRWLRLCRDRAELQRCLLSCQKQNEANLYWHCLHCQTWETARNGKHVGCMPVDPEGSDEQPNGHVACHGNDGVRSGHCGRPWR